MLAALANDVYYGGGSGSITGCALVPVVTNGAMRSYRVSLYSLSLCYISFRSDSESCLPNVQLAECEHNEQSVVH